MIARSEYGARCPHCTRLNPASVLVAGGGARDCIHCKKSFTYWIEKLPFFCTDDGRKGYCDCGVCSGNASAKAEACTNPNCADLKVCLECGKGAPQDG